MNSLFEPVTLLALAARIASFNSDIVHLFDGIKSVGQDAHGLVAVLDVTVDESTAADKLDVYIQTRPNGLDWIDVIHFTQHDGNAGAKRYVAKITMAAAQAEFEVGAALAEANVRNIFADEWRARVVIIDDSASASFTFGVGVAPI